MKSRKERAVSLSQGLGILHYGSGLVTQVFEIEGFSVWGLVMVGAGLLFMAVSFIPSEEDK